MHNTESTEDLFFPTHKQFFWGAWFCRGICYLLPVFFRWLPSLPYRWSVLKVCRHYQLEGSRILLKVHQREAVARCAEGIFSEGSAPCARGPEYDSALHFHSRWALKYCRVPLVAKGEENHLLAHLSLEEAPCPWCCTCPGAHIQCPPPPLTTSASPPDAAHFCDMAFFYPSKPLASNSFSRCMKRAGKDIFLHTDSTFQN